MRNYTLLILTELIKKYNNCKSTMDSIYNTMIKFHYQKPYDAKVCRQSHNLFNDIILYNVLIMYNDSFSNYMGNCFREDYHYIRDMMVDDLYNEDIHINVTHSFDL